MGDTLKELFGVDGYEPFKKVRDPLGLDDLPGHKAPTGAKFPALPDAEAESLKDTLLKSASSGLHYVGTTLDKPARAIRGALSGNAREALAAIPFSDTLGLTDPKQAVSMDDLLVKNKLVRPNDPTKWEVRDFAVPALEIAADPLTWINPLGGATKLGKLASGLGIPTRVLATLVGRATDGLVADWEEHRGLRRRIALYLRHPELGADMIQLADGRPEVSHWARAHHDRARLDPTILPAPVVKALVDADAD